MKILLLMGIFAFIALVMSGCSSVRKTQQLGLIDGQLRPCPDSPNCVSSMATDAAHQVDPFQLQVAPKEAWTAMKKTVPELARTQIVLATENYLHVECRSAVFSFVDDLELHLLPKQQQIAVRSAARRGYSDFGVNRKRVEELRKKLRAAGVVR